MNLETCKRNLNNPEKRYRTAVFWSWNGNLQEAELHRQMEDFADKGLGGFVMHAREGLEVPYLSTRWNNMIKSCAGKGRKLGLKTYIYDDDKWPSGMAGGKVAAENPEFRARAIVLTGEVPGRFAYGAEVDKKKLKHLHFGEITDGERPLYIDVQASGSSDWYSGSAPANNLDHRSVAAFLKMTHEKYKKKFSGKLSDYVDGFFTDEPNFADFFAVFAPGCPWLPWTEGFETIFEKKRGYSILPYLPYLFYQGEKAPKIRHDYWRTMTELFSQTYFKQIYDWCEANGVQNMGHLLFENSLCSQTRVCGAAMPHYQYLHIPGIDILGERTEEYLTVKQCTSVANQMGRRAISETYGCSGWQMSFEGQKWLWDWQAVQGISIRCPHLAQYTIKGLRKRDYPPVFNYQAAWWNYDHILEDYCARLSVCADTGKVVRSILVLHPQSSVWLRCGSDPEEDLVGHYDGNMGWTDSHIMGLNAEYDRLNRLTQSLLKNQCDFDFGDELLMAEHATVSNGCLLMGQAKYSTIVVPELDTIFASTLELLRRFEETGGKVLWLRKLPTMVDGEASPAIAKAFPRPAILKSEQKLLEALEIYRLAKVTDITTGRAAPIMTSLRKGEDGYLLLTVNNDRSRGYRCRIEFPVTGAVEEYDLLTGKTTPLVTDRSMGVYQDFGPADAKVYLLNVKQRARIGDIQPVYHDVHESPEVLACLGPVARFTRTEMNTLTLDRCRWRCSGSWENWSEVTSIWQAQREIRKTAGFQPIHENGMPMRYGWITEQYPSLQAQMELQFTIVDLPRKPVYLALEERQAIKVFCNGSVCEKDAGWYKDRAIRLVKLKKLRKGENRILLDITYTHEMELEDCYLCGDFAVDLQGRIVSEPETLRVGDWGLQGYPHYAGSMIYHFTADCAETKARLQLGEARGTLVTARINGGEPVYIPWRAANQPLVELQPGTNNIDVEVVGSNRNLFGPLHQPYQLCSRIDWRDFRTEEGRTSEVPVLEPYGLFSQCYLLREPE